MKPLALTLLPLLLLTGCDRPSPSTPAAKSAAPAAVDKPEAKPTLAEARRGFKTTILRPRGPKEAVDPPPTGVFDVVRYDSPAGKLAAYLTPPPKDGKKRPAIVWLFGGFSNGIGDTAWDPAPPSNDQSARA